MADTVKDFLIEAGKTPLLTSQQEIEYAKEIQKGKEYLYTSDLDLDQEQLELKQRSMLYLNKFQTANIRLVISIAKKYKHSNLELLDLVQEGCVGLRQACLKYDHTLGYKFSTMAYWWIRQAISRAIQNNSRTIRTPVHIQELHRSIKRVIKDYEIKHGVKPSILYIAEELEITREKVINTLSAMRSTSSLDVNINNSDGQPTLLLDLIQDDKVVGPDEVIESVNLNETLNELLNILSDKQRTVLELRFGLYTNKALSLAKVGEKLGCSRENIRLIERHALHALRTHRNINDLEELYLS